MARIYKIRIYQKRVTERNPHPLTVYLAGDDDDEGTFQRVYVGHKGIIWPHLAQRNMTIEEIKLYEASWRMRTMNYMTWEGLIEDEYQESGFNQKWCEHLLRISGIKKQLEDIVELPNPW